MKKVEQLRAQLAALIAARGPVGQTGRQMWTLAEQIAAATGEPVRDVFRRGTSDAVARLSSEVER
jgi:hypothetical protein